MFGLLLKKIIFLAVAKKILIHLYSRILVRKTYRRHTHCYLYDEIVKINTIAVEIIRKVLDIIYDER